jgi:hypothetical protein
MAQASKSGSFCCSAAGQIRRHNNVVNFAGNARPGDLVAVEILSTQNGFSLHSRLR